MAAIKLPNNLSLGAIVKAFPKTQYEKIVEIINKLNELSVTAYTLVANTISPSTAGNPISFTSSVVEHHTASAINATATATAAQLATGLVTSTSAAATAITFPTAASLLSALGAARGSSFDLIVDNSAGANTVTMTPSATITAATAVITGGATLTVASGATGIFRIYFASTTVARVYRIG